MLYGSNYIHVDLYQNPMQSIPLYIVENLPMNEYSQLYQLPKYGSIKFRGNQYSIDEFYNIFQITLKAREWNVNKKILTH